MAINIKEELNLVDKEVLMQIIVAYGEAGFFPEELFYLRSDNLISFDALKDCWRRIYNFAFEKDKSDSGQAASVLEDGANLCFEKAKLFSDKDEMISFCKMLVEELHEASESDGIGMKWDNDWLYMEVAEKIEVFLEEQQNNYYLKAL